MKIKKTQYSNGSCIYELMVRVTNDFDKSSLPIFNYQTIAAYSDLKVLYQAIEQCKSLENLSTNISFLELPSVVNK